MPRLSKAKKDVISCEKLGGGANIHYIPRSPNGATRRLKKPSSGLTRSKRGELKHLSTHRKRKQK